MSRCITIEEHLKLHRQWVRMCWLCCALLALAASCGVLMLEYKREALEYSQALDEITSEQVALERLIKNLEKKRR